MDRINAFIGDAPNKHFSYGVITWEIRRFSFIRCFQRAISSPQLKLAGPIETSWKMHVCIPSKKNEVLLKLELLSDIDPFSRVKVHWASCFLGEKKESTFLNKRFHSFAPKYNLTVQECSLKYTLEMLNKNQFDNLVIKCCMLVNFGLEGRFLKSRVEGVVSLSNDLYPIPNKSFYHDIETKVKNVDFYLHKAMLYQRSDKLAHLIEQSASDIKVNFSLSDSKAAEALFLYLYTGDLWHILNQPNLTILDYINRLGVLELKNLYPEDAIKIVSRVPVREHEFSWLILGFKNINKTLVSHKLHKDCLKAGFELYLTIKESEDDKSKKSLFVEAKLVESEEKIAVWIEIACANEENNIINSQKTHGVMAVGDGLCVKLLDSDFLGMEECFLSETLIIKFRVSIRDGDVLTEIKESERLCKDISNERSLMNLSKLLKNLMKSNDYSDLSFRVNDKEVKAHRFLVAARSSFFNEVFRRENKLDFITVDTCRTDTFEAFLSFLYIGITTENDAIKLMELYQLGKFFNVGSLMHVCINLLKKFINDDNMLKVLAFVHDVNVDDEALQKTAFKYVLDRATTLEAHPDFSGFQRRKPGIYAQIKDMVPKE